MAFDDIVYHKGHKGHKGDLICFLLLVSQVAHLSVQRSSRDVDRWPTFDASFVATTNTKLGGFSLCPLCPLW
jgi:hypothetical protein